VRGLALIALIAGLLAGPAAARAEPVSARFKDGLVFVDAEVNGARGVFLLDTGAAASAFDPRFARLAFVRLGRPRDVVGRGGDVGARQGEAVELTLAGGPSARIAPVVMDLSQASGAMGVPLAGILGEDFLGGFVLALDYRGRTLALDGEVEVPPDATHIRFGQTPYVEARTVLGGRVAAGEFEIDTGSNTAIEFWRPFARAGLGDQLGHSDIGLGVAGRSVIERGHIDVLEVAGRRIAAPEVNFADDTRPDDAGPRYGGVIGGPAWDGLVLVLDLPRRLMWLR
jgi:hypothetical protein